MDPISATCQSIEAVTQLLKDAQARNLDLAMKMVRVSTEIAVGAEYGKGALIDVSA
jgi:hypothetical protein